MTYDYDGDTGRAFINGEWVEVDPHRAEAFEEETTAPRFLFLTIGEPDSKPDSDSEPTSSDE
jgi:hypothetical protein